MKTKIDALWIAEVIAEADDEIQGQVFNELGRCLELICKGRNMDNQICYLSDKLDFHGRKFIKEVYGYVELIERQIEQKK